MLNKALMLARKSVHETTRKLISWLPRDQRFKVFRSFVDCDPAPSDRLVLKIAETKDELEASFAVLHDAYVDSGFMKPDESGMRVTIYHALPTTTTICAKLDGKVVGTISLIRDSALGVPMQQIFDLTPVRAKGGNLAEVSALAVHRKFRKTGGSVLFPLMKFMYEYCTAFFDVRHLVIAVNPSHIEMYESMLFFRRLTARMVDQYDFVNGAPAIGATLDLKLAPEVFRKHYASKPARRNLHAYFTETKLSNIQLPSRRFFTTSDPVMTPELLDHFFNKRTRNFATLKDRQKALLHSIYDLPQYQGVLPPFAATTSASSIRRQQRFSVKCPARLAFATPEGEREIKVDVFDLSLNGFQAQVDDHLPLNAWCDATVQLGEADVSRFRAIAVREKLTDSGRFLGFRMNETDDLWKKFVSALCESATHRELEKASLSI